MSTKEQEERVELLQGTLDLLILRTLQLGPTHGHAIAKAIELRSDDVLQVEQGSLYPALQRMLKEKLVRAEWQLSPTNRRVRTYRITTSGIRHLGLEVFSFEQMLKGIYLVLSPAES